MNLLVIILSIILVVCILSMFSSCIGLKEDFCYGNVYCNGNNNNALCINQSCLPCGLEAKCTKDSECSPNLCKNGCCDTV